MPPCWPRLGPAGRSDRLAGGARLDRLLDAIWQVETNRGRNVQRGDGGRARGQLQQHRGHWRRGCEVLGVDWPWPAATADLAKCRAVAIANWWRDARPYLERGDLEELARRFRLPFAPHRADNDAYWRKVRAAMRGARR